MMSLIIHARLHMHTRFFLSGLIMFLGAVFGLTQGVQAASWPASSSAQQIYSSSSIEPSGIVWHPRLEKLLMVGDEGQIIQMSATGVVDTTWTPGGDLEGITLADQDSDNVYVIDELTDKIKEFSLSQGAFTGKVWDVTGSLPTPVAGYGIEALTFVPNEKHSFANSNSGGVFYAGLQANGTYYVFDLTLSASGQFSYLGTVDTGFSSISDAYYSEHSNIVYTLAGSSLREMRPNGEILATYSVPGTRQEGFTLIEACPATSDTVVIAEDTPGSVKAYASYPVNTTSSEYSYYTDVDADGLGSDTAITLCSATTPSGYVTNSNDLNDSDYDNDGVSTVSDCNDSDASILANQTYYLDADQDGLGSATFTTMCSYTTPAGYVTNSTDSNDADFDNDGVSTGVDCNDADASIAHLQTYYVDADADGLGSDTTSSTCSYTLPSGYVTNSNDLNDADFDNDGVSTDADCNDADATQTTGTTFYQDLDSDGMGSSITSTLCSASAPSGYVANSNESTDANDLIPNAGIEIAADQRDNDGDGQVDEYNYVSTNGYHPFYSLLNPDSTSLAASSILNFSGATNGYIKVKYADNSVFRYRVFNQTTHRNTKVRQVNSTGYLLVTAVNGLRAYVNAYTGDRTSSAAVKMSLKK